MRKRVKGNETDTRNLRVNIMVEVSKKLQNEIAAVQAAIVSPIANKEPDNSPLVEIAARIAAMEARALAEAEAQALADDGV